MKKYQSGFSVIEALIIVVILAVVGAAGWTVLHKNEDKNQPVAAQTTTKPKTSQPTAPVKWDIDGSGNWMAMSGTPPTCPTQPMLKLPVDINQVTAILYPGQTRGGNYKAHGGFRLDSVRNNVVTVTAPMDGYVYRGSRYLVNGETQYTFDIINSCGVMYRLGHLLALEPKYQALANKFPAAQEGDSRTERVDGMVAVKTGEKFASKVGVTVGGVNTFFDFGVYDLRAPNAASKQPGYLKQHDLELAGHAVCWLHDWFPSADETKINSLPAGDPTSGKKSDYCK